MNQPSAVLKTIFQVLLVCFGLGLIIDIAPAYAADADDFLITVNTENPGISSDTGFTIPTFDFGITSGPFASGKAFFSINPTNCGALEFNQLGSLSVTGAGVFANSTCESSHDGPQNAITFSGAGFTNIEYDVSTPGGIYVQNPANVTWGSVDTNATQVSFNQIDEPDCSGLPAQVASGTTLQPGVYAGGIIISSDIDVTLEPGLYCLDGDLSMLNGSLTGDGVTIYLRGNSKVNINGGEIHLSAPPPTNPANAWMDGGGTAWDGMLIFYSYDSIRKLYLNSNIDSDFVGTIYNYGAECILNGSGASAVFNTQVVCDTITISGNADTTIHYNHDSQYSLVPQGGYNYNVDCNDDGTYEATGVTGDYTCDYAALDGAGIYTIRISDNAGDGTGFPRIFFNNGGDKEKLLSIDQWGTGKWTSMENAFEGCVNMTSSAADAPDLSNVTDMSWMFSSASSFNTDISGWETGNVTNMSGLFADASAFNQDISLWDVSAVTDMSWMFAYSGFNQNINNWNTISATNMRSMFEGTRAFNQPLDSWNTANVTNMVAMFYDTASFNQPIGTWETGTVTDMSWMFAESAAFNQDLSGWTTSAVTNMSGMFGNASAFNQNIGGWETSTVTDMSWMFENASAFNQDISGWTTTAVTDMSGMFSNASAFNQNISGWNTGAVTDMSWMFENASVFNQPIGSWATSAVIDMSGMFTNADAFNQDIGGWDVSALTDASWMFDGVALSTKNYDALLNGWNAQALQPNVTFDGGYSTYCNGEAARANMIASDNWEITDDGKNCYLPPLNGAAEITSDQPIVAIGRPHMGTEIMAYGGVNAGANTIYLPMLFANKWGYTSSFTVQNLGASTATFDLILKDALGGDLTCRINSETLPEHGVRTYDVTNLPTCDIGAQPTVWFGGATISSDLDVTAVVRVNVDGTDAVTYNAFTGGNGILSFPMLFKDIWGYQAAFYVQNVSNIEDSQLRIKFFDSMGNFTCQYLDPDPIGPFETRGYWMGNITNENCDALGSGTGFLPGGWAGVAWIYDDGSSESIVGIARPHMGDEVAAYSASMSSAIENYLPMLFREEWGYNSAIYVQSAAQPDSITVSINFYDTYGNFVCKYDDPELLMPWATRGYWLPFINCNDGNSFPLDGFAGSARIITSGPAVALGRPHLSDGQVVAYNGFQSGGTDVYVPMLFRQYGSNESALYIQNLSETTAANTTITFYDEDSGFYCTMDTIVQPGASGAIWLAGLDNFLCTP